MQKIINALYRCIFFIFFAICYQVNAGLDVIVRNVGQGNCVAIKNGNKAIVIDCGVHQSGGYRALESMNKDINPSESDPFLNFLLGCELTVFLTHTHYDHFSILPYIIKNASSKYIAIQSIYCSDFEPTESYKSLQKTIPEIISVNTLADVAGIELLLGAGAKIEAVIPDPWPQVGKRVRTRSTDPNDNSLVLVVTDIVEKKKFLFPGDATGLTLEYIRRSPTNLEKLQDIDCIFIPHHGSNLSGAFDWFHFIKGYVTQIRPPLLAVISSDPTECDFLPWFGISQFDCFRCPLEIFDESEVSEHTISVTGGASFLTQQPIFVTKNAVTGFYHIISQNQSIQLFESGTCQFLSNKEVLSDHAQIAINQLLSENKLEEAGTKLIETYGPLENIPYELLTTITRYPFFRDLVIASLQEKLEEEFDINVLMKAAEYIELTTKVIEVLSRFHSSIEDEYLINLRQQRQFAEIVNQIVMDRYTTDIMPLDVTLKVAQYPELSTIVTRSLETNRDGITGSQLINLLKLSHLAEFAGLLFDSKLSESGSISSEMIQVILDMVTKSERGILAKTVYPFAASHAWLQKINNFFSKSNPLAIPHETLVVAAQYPELNEILLEILHSRYKQSVFLTEEEWLDYMRYVKRANNIDLLIELTTLPIIKE